MRVVYAIDMYGNNYVIVQHSDYFRLENSELDKNDYFGYVDSNKKFVSCKAHKNKYPQSVFAVGDHSKLFRIKDPRK